MLTFSILKGYNIFFTVNKSHDCCLYCCPKTIINASISHTDALADMLLHYSQNEHRILSRSLAHCPAVINLTSAPNPRLKNVLWFK